MPISASQALAGWVTLVPATGNLVTSTVLLLPGVPTLLAPANPTSQYIFIQNTNSSGGSPVTVSTSSTVAIGAGLMLPAGAVYDWKQTTPAPAQALYGISNAATVVVVGTMAAAGVMQLAMFADSGLGTTQTNSDYANALEGCPNIRTVVHTPKWKDLELTPGTSWATTPSSYAFDAVLGPLYQNAPLDVSFWGCIRPGFTSPAWLTASVASGGLGCDFMAQFTSTFPGASPVNINYPFPACFADGYVWGSDIYTQRLCSVLTAKRDWELARTDASGRTYYSRVSGHRLTPVCTADDEVGWSTIEYLSDMVTTFRDDQAWASLGWRPDRFLSWWTNFTSFLTGLYPGRVLSIPFLDDITLWPQINAAGVVDNSINTETYATSLLQGSMATAPALVMIMSNTMDAGPPPSAWSARVALGARAGGQANEHGGGAVGMVETRGIPPTIYTAGNIVGEAAEVANTEHFELHQVDVQKALTIPNYQAAFSRFGGLERWCRPPP